MVIFMIDIAYNTDISTIARCMVMVKRLKLKNGNKKISILKNILFLKICIK